LKDHIRGVDSLRFIAAMWVAFGHGAWLPVRALTQQWGSAGRAVTALSDTSFNGVAAVIVFFIISGFCIHLPYVGATKIDIRDFYIRRYVRIGGPLLIVLAIAQFWADPAASAVKLVLWSVYCELAYYTLYPFLLPLLSEQRIKKVIAVSTVLAALLIALRWGYLRHWEFGVLTFLVGYPTWFLGCLLAEKIRTKDAITLRGNIWLWRLGAWLCSVAAMDLVFHSPIKIGYPASLLLFSFYCYFWLQQELTRWRRIEPIRWIEAAGAGSYSIYLVHTVVITAVEEMQLQTAPMITWAVVLASVLAVSYVFFRLFERPFHLAARKLARMFRRPPATKPDPAPVS
jgi:peptidoglycan/LPS O-acetylase OafA/YrhL